MHVHECKCFYLVLLYVCACFLQNKTWRQQAALYFSQSPGSVSFVLAGKAGKPGARSLDTCVLNLLACLLARVLPLPLFVSSTTNRPTSTSWPVKLASAQVRSLEFRPTRVSTWRCCCCYDTAACCCCMLLLLLLLLLLLRVPCVCSAAPLACIVLRVPCISCSVRLFVIVYDGCDVFHA
jgi:hypothetical protein